MTYLESLRSRLSTAMDDARQVYQADRDSGGPSKDFDAGRFEGLKEALELVNDFAVAAGL